VIFDFRFSICDCKEHDTRPHLLEMHGTDAGQVGVNITSSPSQDLGKEAAPRKTDACPGDKKSDGLTITLSDTTPAPLLQRVWKICCCDVG
jgi:hypothetical protein